jgi:hypothetical protein
VQEALANATPPDRQRMARDLSTGLDQLGRLPVSPGRVIVIATVAGIAIAVGVVALLVWLVTLVL